MRELNREEFGKIKAVIASPFDRAVFDRMSAGLRLRNTGDPSGNTWTERKAYYDSYSVAVNTQVIGQVKTLLQTQVGGTTTLATTNMRDTGRIANGNLFTIKQFGCFLTSNSLPSDVQNVLELMTVKLKVQDIVYAEGKVSMFPGGRGAVQGGAALPAAIGTLAQISGVTNGVAHIDNVFRFLNGIPVAQGQSIAVELVSEGNGFTTATAVNGGSGFTLTVLIDGFETRRTQ
jgi:hypothetical protein